MRNVALLVVGSRDLGAALAALVASEDGDRDRGGDDASKAALELLSRTLTRELDEDGVTVIAIDPEDLRARMHERAHPLLPPPLRGRPRFGAPF